MIYFKDKGKGIVEKYAITFDSKKLKGLRSRIINKCSIVEHEEEILLKTLNKENLLENMNILILQIQICIIDVLMINIFTQDL